MKKEWINSEGLFVRIAIEKQAKMEEAVLKEYKQDEINHLDSELKALRESADASKANSEEIVSLSKELSELKNNELKALLKAVEKNGEAVAKGLSMTTKDVESMADQFVASFKEKQASIDKIKGESGAVEIELKTDVTSGSSVVDNTFSTVVPGIGKIPVRPTLMEARFKKGSFGVNSGGKLTYLDQNTLNRAANNVAECALIPESEIDWKEYDCKAEKIGDSIPICMEALEDFAFIKTEVENFLIENILLRMDQQLLLGTGTSPELKGIDSVAQTWGVGVGSPIESLANSVDTPTTANVVFTAVSQIKNSGASNSFRPNYVDLNPQDYQLMLLEKDANKNSLNDVLVSIDANGQVKVAGVPVFENPLVPQDVIYVGDYSRGAVYNHRRLTITIATQHDTDFLRDRVRLRGTVRKALLIRNVNANAFLKVTSIAAAKIALAKP